MSNLIEAGKSLDSREVAEMVGKNHTDLMRDIRRYAEYLNESKIALVEFFQESTYLDAKGETRPCYLISKKGCEMIANKLTGKKGILFTAAYVTKFNEMEKQAAPLPQMTPSQLLAAIARQQADQEAQLISLEQKVDGIRDVVSLSSASWRKDTSDIINRIAKNLGGPEHIKPLREESYKLLNERMGVDLKARLTNKRQRMAVNGAPQTKRDNTNYLDIIGEDKKLIEGYVAIVKDMAIKYGLAQAA